MRPLKNICPRRSGAALALVISLLATWTGALAGNDPNACDDPAEFPDVIVGEIDDAIYWGSVGDISAFSFSTWSCNIGTCELDWIFNTPNHPVIGQNLFRLKDGRFEQVGQSWLKHGFFALSFELCETGCIATDGTTLGVNCSDPYSAALNGDQPGLGPKSEVNPSTGEYPYPFTEPDGQSVNAIFKRLQVRTADIAPAFNPGASYFVEGHYVALDDATAGRNNNNASYRKVRFGDEGGGLFVELEAEFGEQQPAIAAWKVHDPDVVLTFVDDAGGRFHLGSKATPLGDGFWEYEYAVQNVNSHRGAGAVRVPIPAGATVTGIGFHDVDYHSGEPYDGTDWVATIEGEETGHPQIVWRTEAFETNVNANALRWGTLYNFRFAIDSPPSAQLQAVQLDLWRPGPGTSVSALLTAPSPCDLDGVCDSGETCINCAADCLGPDETCCGDGVCEGDEDGCVCSVDCGECPIPCDTAPDCDDNLFCNGEERCLDGFCEPALEAPCEGQICSPQLGACVECIAGATCDDGDFCNGAETCSGNVCAPGPDPCPGQFCDPDSASCVTCLDDDACGDGLDCNGEETCVDGECTVPTGSCIDGQPLMGQPVAGLSASQRQRFEAGKALFSAVHTEADGLGPLYNGDRCSSCHSDTLDGSGAVTVTRFGQSIKSGFDPLTTLGGPLLHEQSLGEGCEETLPPEADVVAPQLVRSTLGVGLIEAIPDSTLHAIAASAPGVTGRVHEVDPLEAPGTVRAGRFGWKAQSATLLTLAATEARDHIGLTHRLLDEDNAPGGDTDLLAQCDTVADPETDDFIDRVADYLRYLAPPPQTPRSGLSGETQFFSLGCASCHTTSITTGTSNGLDSVLQGKALRPYSDFLLHDMGAAGDPTGVGDAQPGEVRTTPLWGIRTRDPLWHDGRVSGGTFAERVTAAIQLHDAAGSEASASAQAFFAQNAVIQNLVIAFLDSLGRAEFDHDGDHDVDVADYQAFLNCYTGPGGSYSSNHPCRISDFDQDGDVDIDDFDRFNDAFEGTFGGAVPDGSSVAGQPLTMDLQSGGSALVLSWDPSCAAEDTDYAIYRGTLGSPSSHVRFACTTDGETTTTLTTPSFSAYYLVVPTNGLTEGSHGRTSAGAQRPAVPPSLACFPRRLATCN